MLRTATIVIAASNLVAGFAPGSFARAHARTALRALEDESVPKAVAEVSADATAPTTESLEASFSAAPADVSDRDRRLSSQGATDLGDDWRFDRAVPFLPKPKYSTFDVQLGGDASFDPLGFADTPEKLLEYRDAELKHGRLAMLAAAGWPLSELWDKQLADAFNLPSLLVDGKAPSILNGGLGGISIAWWAFLVGGTSAIEIIGNRQFKTLENPGAYSFDPLGLHDFFGDKAEMEAREVKNGRLAMVAIIAFAFQEFVSGVPVVNETPFFFEPISTFMGATENAGYIHL